MSDDRCEHRIPFGLRTVQCGLRRSHGDVEHQAAAADLVRRTCQCFPDHLQGIQPTHATADGGDRLCDYCGYPAILLEAP